MHITVNRNELSRAMAWVAGGLPKRPVVPVLHGIQLTVEGSTLTMGVFDYEQSRRAFLADTWGDAEPGKILVSGPRLKDAIRSLPKATKAMSDVTLSGDDAELTVSIGGVKWQLPTVPDTEYPEIPALPALAGTVPGAEFARSVNRVAPAASTDDTLPLITNIQFQANVGYRAKSAELSIAATDRYRLAHDRIIWTPNTMQGTEFLVPATLAAAFAKDAGKYGAVGIHASGHESGRPVERVGFRDALREVTTRPMEGQFVRWHNMFRAKSPVNVTADARELAEALTRMNAVTASGWNESTRHGIVDLHFADGKLTVHAIGDDMKTRTSQESVSAEADQPEFTVRFCAPYLADMLRGITGRVGIGMGAGGEEPGSIVAAVELRDRIRPAVVTAVDRKDRFRALVMPVRLADL